MKVSNILSATQEIFTKLFWLNGRGWDEVYVFFQSSKTGKVGVHRVVTGRREEPHVVGTAGYSVSGTGRVKDT